MKKCIATKDGGFHKDLSAEEEAEIRAGWAEADRPRTVEEFDAEKDSVAELFDNPKRGAKAQAWVNYKFIKDPNLYDTQLKYWRAIKLAYRDRPWKL